MYIVAIAWLFITLMMAITEKSAVAGVLTFVFYGLAPCALLLWLMGTPHRRRSRAKAATAAADAAAQNSVGHEQAEQGNRAHAESDQQDLKQ
ncbi:MAG: hypothetical protein KAY04_05930 [Burkholderiales bacterium]|nr:hypothetical protein [Burkholderiales bacterium]